MLSVDGMANLTIRKNKMDNHNKEIEACCGV